MHHTNISKLINNCFIHVIPSIVHRLALHETDHMTERMWMPVGDRIRTALLSPIKMAFIDTKISAAPILLGW